MLTLPALLLLFAPAVSPPVLTAHHSPSLSPRGEPAGARGTAHRSGATVAAVITFRLRAEVRDPIIRLVDVAAVEGENAGLVARLEAVEVGRAPLAGHSRTVSAQYARVRIRQIGVDVGCLHLGGEPLVTVIRPEQLLPGTALENAVRAAVEAANPGAAAEVTSPPADLHLPDGTVALQPHVARPVSGSSGSVAIEVRVDGRPEAWVTLGYRLVHRAPVVVVARDVPLGTVLTEADLRVEERPTAPGPMLLSDVSLAVGQQAAVPIRAGTALGPAMLRPAVLIKRGSRVTLVCKGTTFTATVAGEALQDAVAGQPIRVRNLTSLLEVTGTAVSAQLVEVPF